MKLGDPADSFQEMLRWLLARLRRAPRSAPVRTVPDAVPDVVVAPPPRAEGPTLTAILQQVIEEVGGPASEPALDTWRPLVEEVLARAETVRAPPSSFPLLASELLAMLRDPNLDLNVLVGAVQRDAAVAMMLLRIANSVVFAPVVPVTTLRGAIQMLGVRQVVELAVGNAGRSLYEASSRAELELYPELWGTMFGDAMANAFTAGWLALDLRQARSDRALLAGLLADVGRPVALRIVTSLVRSGGPKPSEGAVAATIEEVSPAIGARVVAAMGLPADLRTACAPPDDGGDPSPELALARLVAAIGAIQRRSPRTWKSAADVREAAERLRLSPHLVRTAFAQRQQYVAQASKLLTSRASGSSPARAPRRASPATRDR